MEGFCSEFSIVMPKCIRLTDLSILKRLPEFGCTNYQVLISVQNTQQRVGMWEFKSKPRTLSDSSLLAGDEAASRRAAVVKSSSDSTSLTVSKR